MRDPVPALPGRSRPRTAGRARAVALTLAAAVGLGFSLPAGAQEVRGDDAPDPSPGFDVLAYDLRLSLEPGSRTIRAEQRVRLLVTSGGLDSVGLHLEDLSVDSARVAGGAVRPERRDGRVYLPVRVPDGRTEAPPPAPGDTISAVLSYHGEPADGLILRRNLHGDWTVFADNWPDRARHWFASVDHPADKARVTFRLEVPEGWTTVANGLRRESRPLPGGRKREVWHMASAIPTYTMVVGAGRLAERRAGFARAGPGDAAIPLWRITFPEDVGASDAGFRRAAEMLDRFAGRVGPYPYRKLSLVQAATRFGGMENTTAIFFAEEAVAAGEVSETLVAHEIAHMWFGDAVTEARWAELWLSEGFATYFAALWHLWADGTERFREEMEELERSYLDSPVTGQPVIPEATPDSLLTLLDANNYEKGAWVLHMLRIQLGDDAFYQGLRRYFLRHRHGAARTADLRRALEDASGRELERFFDQWLRRPGYPELEAEWSREERGGRPGVLVRLRQVPGMEGGSGGGRVFRLLVPVELRAAGETAVHRRWLEARSAEWWLPAPGPVDAVEVDPANTLLGPARVGPAPAGESETD